MSQRRPELGSGVMKFYSHEEVVKYLRELAEYYQKESEKYGDKLGSMLRGTGRPETAQKEAKKDEKKPEAKKASPGGWTKMGSILINTTNAEAASTEVMYQVHEDLKLKLARTTEALKSFEQNANAVFAQNSVFEMFFKNGVPERIVVRPGEGKRPLYNFDGRFRVV